MKLELIKMGKTLAFNAGKYMPKALIGVSAGATVGSIFLAVKAGMEYQQMKDKGEEITFQDYVRIFGPCVAAGVFSIACAFAGLTESEKRYAAAAALASMYETREKEIEEKAREIFGDNEVNKMNDSIAKDRLDRAQEPMYACGGYAFLDLMTGQWIYMDTETIKSKFNDLNDHMNKGHDISKAEYCDTFDLYSTPVDEYSGWNNIITGNIKYDFIWHKLASGRDVAAIRLRNEPKLFWDEEVKDDEEVDEYYRQRNPGWSEV